MSKVATSKETSDSGDARAGAPRRARERVKMGRRDVLSQLAWVASASPLASVLGCGSDGDTNDPAAGGAAGSVGSGMDTEAAGTSATAPDTTTVTEAIDPASPLSADPLPLPPAWDDVPTCAASNTDGAGQGPFFIHDAERDDDVSLFRQDIRGRYDQSAEPGTELQLHLRILDAGSEDCAAAPVAGIEVYVWHTDAQGYYSGFGEEGDQEPDEPYAGTPNQNDLVSSSRFCRGVQVTDADGVVSFRSIFPGWYNGRDVHIHLVALRPGSASRGRETYAGGEHIFTTQFYFDPELTDQVHKASEPYLRRKSIAAYAGAIAADEPNNSGLRAKATFDGTTVVAQIQILLDPG
jgi:protocatechuate 3,4-dioxygenase beta subunit